MKRTCILRRAIDSRKKRYVFVHLNQLKLHSTHVSSSVAKAQKIENFERHNSKKK